MEPTEAVLSTAISHSIREVQNPDGDLQRDTTRADLFPAGRWLCLQETEGSGFQRKPERADLVPGRGVASGSPLEKNGEAADGEYWPGNDGACSIKISNKEVIGTGCLVVGF